MLFATRFFLIRIIVFFRNCRKLYFYHSLVVYSFSFKSFSLLLFFRLKFLHYEVFNVLGLSFSSFHSSVSASPAPWRAFLLYRMSLGLSSSFFAFFYLFCSSLAPLRQLCYIIKFTPACQSFYLSFSSLFLIIFLSSLKALKTSYVTPFLSIKILVPRSHSVIINGIFFSFTISHEGCTTSTPISS